MNESEQRAYVALVAMWLFGAGGYRIEEQFVKGEQIITGAPAPAIPEYVIRLDLDGPYADLTWNTREWSIVVCEDADAFPSGELSRKHLGGADARPAELLRAVKPILTEAIRRWGNPQWMLTAKGAAAADLIEQMAGRPLRTVEDLPEPTVTFAEIKAIAGWDGA